MTESERCRLLGCLPLEPSPFWPPGRYQFRRKFIEEVIGAVLAAAIILGFQSKSVRFVIPVCAGLLLFWWTLHIKSRFLNPLREWRSTNAKVGELHDAVNAATVVRVCSVEANEVVEVLYDEGTICLFDIGDDRTFCVDPYSMIPGKPPKDWPNRRFEIVSIPGIDEEAGPFCLGKPLRAKRKYEFQELFETSEFAPPKDGVINRPLEEFVSDAKSGKLVAQE